MMTAVGFNNQPMLKTNKIGDVVSNRKLTTKFISGQFLVAQKIP